MIIESDDQVFELDRNRGTIVKAIPSAFMDEWIVITEDEFGDVLVKSMTAIQMVEEYGEFPTD